MALCTARRSISLSTTRRSEACLGSRYIRSFHRTDLFTSFGRKAARAADTANVDQVALLGNRVDRYVWNGSTLTFDRNLIKLRALQPDAGQPSRGNHNGGVVRVGPDGKVYIIFGDNGRRGFLQNITSGGPVPDDQFGGPEPDDAHFTGVILRLNDDGSTPTDNPFFDVDHKLNRRGCGEHQEGFCLRRTQQFRNGFRSFERCFVDAGERRRRV